MTETNRIEYKRELSDGLEKEVIAFLNYREGGIIYIGIDKEGNTYGLADADGDQLKIKDRLKNNIRPSALGLFDILSEERYGKNILKIIVASGPEKPYHLKKYGMSEKGCFIRLGSAAEPMPQKMIDELFAKRTRNSISKIKACRQDLGFGQLKIYYEESGHTLGKAFAKNLELLTEDGAFNYAGYLLADKNNTSIKVAKYSGKTRTDLIESNEYGHECLVKATKQVIDKIAVENRTNTKITAKERQQANLWNPIALREAIINAFVHNDYTNEITQKFEIFADRIEITSAGGLPEGLSKQEFFEGFSVPRNKELMRIFKDLELVEQLGSGIPRILEHYGKESFGFSDNFLRMTFTAKETAVEEDGQIGGVIGGLKGGQIGGQKDDEIDDIKELTHRQKEVLKLIASDNRISRSGIAEVLHINESAIQKHLNNLKDAGFIERVGGTRGYWEINLDKN
ncbi:RNA-binding domain-containing protein [Christiangramia sp. SM2212]|uniref:ATP-binding protein n=1 Tax=Christiangramia sediminicola TaxID=3073267 RepID=A0ABU1ES07_9FLAO|nr:RNA-binding domain-containing protein [Christiangramia sp. SM2212]MDR5591166.1 ATP-binding protein [Christiangramia sp. SM2212]